jgi:type VI secretion system protein VasJ
MAHVLGDQLDACCTLFGGDAPYGEDIKYDETYMDLRAEIQKLTAMSSKEGSIDYKAVRAWSVELLSTKAKDLTVMGYLTMALFILEGYPGLADGLKIVRTFVTDHWEGVFPPAKRARARSAAFEWLVNRLGPLVEDRPAAEADADVLEEVRESAQTIHETIRERLGHQAPTFSDVITAVKSRLEEVAAAAPSPEPSPEAATEQAAAGAATEAGVGSEEGSPAPPQPAPAPEPAPAQQATAPAAERPRAAAAPAPPAPPSDASLSDLRSHVMVLARSLREADPLSPTPYRMLRSLKWDNLQGPPPADPGGSGKTRVPPPRPQQRMALDSMLQGQRWHDLVQAAEGAFQEGTGTFWLDLHRYTAMALEKLGASDSRAARAVKEDTAKLIEMYPNLPGLKFQDDSPFAADATREWLEEIGSGPGLSAMLAPPAAAAGEAAGSTLEVSDLEQAAELFAKKKPAAALALLQGGVDRAVNKQGRFRTRLEIARACLQGNQPAWGRTILEDLRSQLEGITLPEWEPELAVQVYQLAGLCYARLAKDRKTEDRETVRELLEDVKARLFRLDMRAAAVVEEAS